MSLHEEETEFTGHFKNFMKFLDAFATINRCVRTPAGHGVPQKHSPLKKRKPPCLAGGVNDVEF
ncbi:MAG TPA: hypothetical protein DHU55_01805 [Blastocatellia bacterium]|nr:hypothetical protein [Blastocatellia bacterium]HAF22664.1 hypothetical protein [Blastocatellia bacterium]HCX28499.1 hypothetical protein [Blastocatellia bacterium]